MLAVETRGQSGWYGPLLNQWRAALLAEAAVLATNPNARLHCAQAEQTTAGNPIATILTLRAKALATRDNDTLLEIARQLNDLDAPYQAARTIVLAGRSPRRHDE